MNTQATLLQALQALYHDPNADTRKVANQWLQEFQRSLDAWQICDNLLHNSNSSIEILYFCSQTLRTKVQHDFDDLPTSSKIPLRDSVLILLRKFQNGPASVRTQLCLALAALAMHMSAEEWGSGGVINWLKKELNATNDGIPSMLELLTVLPQEALSHKTSVKPERRRQFRKELAACAQDAFQALTDQLTRNAQKYLVEVIGAFAAWLHLSRGTISSSLASHPLVAASLSGLTLEKSFDAAVDAVTELIRFTVDGDPDGLAAQMPLVQIIVPHVMALRPRFAASLKVSLAEREMKMKGSFHASDVEGEEEDIEVMKGIAQLFAEMGESYVDLIANGSAEAMMIVEALIEVASHPDDTIAEITFNFWYRLRCALGKRDLYNFDAERSIMSETHMDRRNLIFQPVFEVLLSLVSYRVKYPEGFETWRKDEKADFKQTRYAVTDVLTDIAAVLGGEKTLELLTRTLLQGEHVIPKGDSRDWHSVEASLYCIRGIAKAVSRTESTVMPKVMMLLTHLPSQQQLLYTAFLTIAAYADWLGSAPSASSLLPHLLNLLTIGFSMSEDPAAAAALAFKHVCDACRTMLGVLYIDTLVKLYTQAMSNSSNFQLSSGDELQIVEGLSMVVSAMPIDQAPQILEALCLPMAKSLEEALSESRMAAQTERISSHKYTISLDRLSNIYRYVNHPEPLSNTFRRLWSLLKLVFIQMGFDMRTMERLCRLCKYVVRVCGRFLGDIMGPLLEQVQEQFQQHHQSCFLYLASEVIKVFSEDQSCASYLGNLILVLFGQTINLLSSMEMFTAHPDVADDCFLLASRCIRYCPHLLVPSPVFHAVIDCAMAGVTIQHREACSSILTFLHDVINLRNSVTAQQNKDVIDSDLLSRGPDLCRILIGALLGAVPESRVDEVIEVILSLAQSYGDSVGQWVQNVVCLIPVAVASEEEQKAFLQAMALAAAGAASAAVRNSIIDMSDACRRSKKSVELVQSVLLPQQLKLIR